MPAILVTQEVKIEDHNWRPLPTKSLWDSILTKNSWVWGQACYPSHMGSISQRTAVQASQHKCETLFQNNQAKRAEGMAKVVQTCLACRRPRIQINERKKSNSNNLRVFLWEAYIGLSLCASEMLTLFWLLSLQVNLTMFQFLYVIRSMYFIVPGFTFMSAKVFLAALFFLLLWSNPHVIDRLQVVTLHPIVLTPYKNK